MRDIEQKEVALVAGGCKPPPVRPKPPSKDYSRENALAKKLSGLERALAFNKTKPEVEVAKPVLAPVTPPQAVDRAFALKGGRRANATDSQVLAKSKALASHKALADKQKRLAAAQADAPPPPPGAENAKPRRFF